MHFPNSLVIQSSVEVSVTPQVLVNRTKLADLCKDIAQDLDLIGINSLPVI